MSTDQASTPPATVEERLAALEERSRPKPSKPLDVLKEWGGVASLAIALLYSFPAGLWDRFVLPGQQAAKTEMAELRSTLDRASEILLQGAQALSAIADPQLADTASRSASNRILLALSAREARFLGRRGEFNETEQILIGLLFFNGQRYEPALRFFEAAGAGAHDVQLKAEAQRMAAKVRFLPSPLQDVAKAREVFAASLATSRSDRRPTAIGVYLTTLGDWAAMELHFGDWACGQRLLQLAGQVAPRASLLDSRGIMARTIANMGALAVRAADQPADGCPIPPPA